MTTIRSLRLGPRMAMLAIVVIAAIGATVLVFGCMTAGAGDFKASEFRAGQMASDSSEPTDKEILIAKVGESSISLAAYKEEILHLGHMRLISQRELDGLGPETGLPTKYLQARQDVVIKWGTETAALSDLIQKQALLAVARDLDLAATEEQIAENIANARAAYDNGEYDEYNKGLITAIGEETYWAEVYPPKAELLLSINNLHAHVAAEGEAVVYKDVKTLWVNYTEGVMGKAAIALPESDEHSITLEDVQGFLADVREVDRESLLIPDEHLQTAPAGTWVIYTMQEDRVLQTIESDEAAIVCSEEDTEGNLREWICDAATETVEIASLDGVILYMIVEPGQLLPVFEE